MVDIKVKEWVVLVAERRKIISQFQTADFTPKLTFSLYKIENKQV